ncbi:MAG: hypothetical protein MI919_06860, partial [Holophagales bacterium]|nr:hypothetical protein [Holophagales bacterium]
MRLAGEALSTADGELRYDIVGGVPILLPGRGEDPDGGPDSDVKPESLSSMAEEYGRGRPPSRVLAAVDRFVQARGDQRSEASRNAFGAVIVQAADSALCLSIGGGPTRAHPRLVNLNIDRFENVDIVGTAYALPYADGAVDA